MDLEFYYAPSMWNCMLCNNTLILRKELGVLYFHRFWNSELYYVNFGYVYLKLYRIFFFMSTFQ